MARRSTGLLVHASSANRRSRRGGAISDLPVAMPARSVLSLLAASITADGWVASLSIQRSMAESGRSLRTTPTVLSGRKKSRGAAASAPGGPAASAPGSAAEPFLIFVWLVFWSIDDAAATGNHVLRVRRSHLAGPRSGRETAGGSHACSSQPTTLTGVPEESTGPSTAGRLSSPAAPALLTAW